MSQRLGHGIDFSACARTLVIVLVWLALGVIQLLDAKPAEAGCTASEKADLAKAGYKRAEIEQQCAKDEDDDQNSRIPSQAPRQSAAVVCQTPWGMCRLNVLLPAGASCACYMPTGVFPGVAR